MTNAWRAAPPAVRAVIGLMAVIVIVNIVSIPLTLSKINEVVTDNEYVNAEQVRTGAKAGALVSPVISIGLYSWLGIKLLQKRRWAWIVLTVLASLAVLGGLISLGSKYRTGIVFVSVPLAVIYLAVLLIPAVRIYATPPPAQFAGYGPWGGPPPGYGPGYLPQPGYGPPPPGYGGYPGQPGYGAPGQPGYGPPPGAPQQPLPYTPPQESPGWGQPQAPPPDNAGGYTPPS